MGIEIGANKITQASGTLTIDTGVPMQLLSSGPVVRPNQCLFIAIGVNAGGWMNLANGWNKIGTFTTTRVNGANCYSAANARFTAPVDGMYYFQATLAHLLKDGANQGYYWHPIFAVNGDLAGRVVYAGGGQPNYRIRGYGVAAATYEDGSLTQIYKLIAGDYVESYLYSNGSPLNRHYPPYQQWSGFLLG